MQNQINMSGGGIKCDNDDCDYRDDTVDLDNYESYINKPCPVCGENLLTQEDYDIVQNIIALTNTINSIAGPVDPEADIDKVTVRFSFDGTGVPEMKVE